MSTVQVAVSFAVEIWKFHNIDLFHQGSFHIRTYLKTNGNYPVIIEAPKIWDRPYNKSTFPECIKGNYVSEPEVSVNSSSNISGNTPFSSSSVGGTVSTTDVANNTNVKTVQPAKAVSKTVMIIYREESLRMFDVMEQTMHFQIDAHSIDEFIYKSDITLVVELWFGEKKHEILEEMKCVCERQLKIHFVPSQGLHHHITVMFDYYYLAATEMIVHGSLVYISPCYLRLPNSSCTDSVTILDKNYYMFQSWHSILFNIGRNNGRRHKACLIHSKLCNLLLTVTENLLTTFQEALTYFSEQQKSKIEKKLKSQLNPLATSTEEWLKFAPNELEKMESILQSQTCEEDIADQASIHITKLSSRILVLFNEYLKTTANNSDYIDSLSCRTHKLRIKRFSEAFFYQESSLVHLLAVYDPNGTGTHEAWISKIRESAYYRGLPPLPIECLVSDGESHDQPIIFEQIYEPELQADDCQLKSQQASIKSGLLTSADDDYLDVPKSLSIDVNTQVTSDSKVCMNQPMAIKKDSSASLSSSSAVVSSASSSSASSSNVYRKKQSRNQSYDTKSIPVMRKLNTNYKCKDNLQHDKSINLVGYRSLSNGAFVTNNSDNQSSNLSLDLNSSSTTTTTVSSNALKDHDNLIQTKKLDMKKGLGTLREVNCCHVDETLHLLDVHRVKLLSRSLPDLTYSHSLASLSSINNNGTNLNSLKAHIKLRKKTGKDYNKRTQSWNCSDLNNAHSHHKFFQSQCDLSSDVNKRHSCLDTAIPSTSGADSQSIVSHSISSPNDERLTIFEMLSRGDINSLGNEDNTSDQISLTTGSLITESSNNNNPIGALNFSEIKSPYHQLHQYQIFAKYKIDLLNILRPHFPSLTLYSQLTNIPGARRPYFSLRDDEYHPSNSNSRRASIANELSPQDKNGVHYIICVHGLDGEHRDLRLVKAYLSLALPEYRLEFLMSECNEGIRTFGDIREMKDRLVVEILEKIQELKEPPQKISFIGHSLGCLLIRAAVASDKLSHLRGKLHTFLSLGGPHLGTLYGSSVLVNMGLWFMQKLRKSTCLQQLALKDANVTDPRQTYLYKLSGEASLQYFRYVLLASSPQDKYVPYHSTRIELCRASVRDSSELGVVYMEMVTKLLQRVLRWGKTTVVRYDAHYTLPRSANNYIGRAAHIALIDSEIFLEKFISVSAAKYFR